MSAKITVQMSIKKRFKYYYSEYRYYLSEFKTAVMNEDYDNITYFYPWYRMYAKKLRDMGFLI